MQGCKGQFYCTFWLFNHFLFFLCCFNLIIFFLWNINKKKNTIDIQLISLQNTTNKRYLQRYLENMFKTKVDKFFRDYKRKKMSSWKRKEIYDFNKVHSKLRKLDLYRAFDWVYTFSSQLSIEIHASLWGTVLLYLLFYQPFPLLSLFQSHHLFSLEHQ